jgi:hypothetical protein
VVPAIEAVGNGFTTNSKDFEDVQPFNPVPVTVYDVIIVGLTVTTSNAGFIGGCQTYEFAPIATRVELSPTHIFSGKARILIFGTVTSFVMVIFVFVVHPPDVIIVTS